MKTLFDRIYLPPFLLNFLSFLAFSGLVHANTQNGDLNASELSPFEKAELKKLINLDFRSLSKQSIQGVLGFDQQYWRNPASVHVIKPEDVTLFGYANTVEALRGVPGMHVSRGLSYENFASMRNFSGFSTQKFLGKIGGREVTQLMLGSANYSVDDYPIAVIDRIEVIRGPGASIWGTNAVNGVINLVTKHSGETQGNSIRLLLQDDGTFMGDYIHGGQISEDSFYRVWLRNQEYSEGILESGNPARDDGHLRKFGFRYDRELGSDLNLYIAGGGATRRLEHTLDLSNRLLYDLSKFPVANQTAIKNFMGLPLETTLGPVPLPLALRYALPAPNPLSYNPAAWNAISNGQVPYLFGLSTTRYERYGELTNDSGHVVAKLEGITDSDLEWSLTGAAEHAEISLGHIGFDWDQTQYDLGFDANQPLDDFHRLSFGFAFRRTELDVSSTVIEPFAFSVPQPILTYNQEFSKFDRFTAYLQDSIILNDFIELSIGTKFEENDLSGTGFQPGLRASWFANDSNVLWAGYAKAHRQPSLRERYTSLAAAKVWNPATLTWSNLEFNGDSSLDREEIDAYEIGWRNRPNENFLIELSSYYYNTKDAVLSSDSQTSAYEAKDAKSYGGELSIDWEISNAWRLKGGYSLARGEVEGERAYDFPEQTASLRSVLKFSDNLTFSQSLFYAGETQIPSDYNPISIPPHFRLDLGIVWETAENWEVGLFGRDLLEPYHLETMYPAIDVEPARVRRTFLLSIYKKF